MCLKPLYSLGSLLPWPQLSYLCAAPGLLLVTSMLFMTESPAHLVRYNSISGLVMIDDSISAPPGQDRRRDTGGGELGLAHRGLQ